MGPAQMINVVEYFCGRKVGAKQVVRVIIEYTPKDTEEEIVIRCHSLDENARKLCAEVEKLVKSKPAIVFYKKQAEYYLPTGQILFFQSEGETVYAHTAEDVFTVRYRLYELEAILPPEFLRISKSAIANTARILSVSRNLTEAAPVQFLHTHKSVYVSRLYFKALKQKLRERSV